MFGNINELMKKQKEELLDHLNKQQISANGGVSGVEIFGNASRKISKINIDKHLLTAERMDELEDLLINAFDDYNGQCSKLEQEAASSAISEIVPSHLKGMLGL